MLIRLTVDGAARELDVTPDMSLLRLLRERLDLLGAKNACEQGECGSCAVWLDGKVVCSCLVAAVQLGGSDVRTVESLAGGAPHPVQEALVEAGAVQCGFCTPGIVVAAVDLLEHERRPSELAIREALSGHLCRCTGYQKIVRAVALASKETS